jgi:hypothetical protein
MMRHAQVPHELLLVVLLHFGFQRRQLLADFIVRFQIGKLLIQRLCLPMLWLSASASIWSIRRSNDSKRAIASSSLPLSS